MRTTYLKNLEHDAFMIWVMCKGRDPSGLENRAKRMRLAPEIVSVISKATRYEDVKKLTEQIAKERYAAEEANINQAVIEYQKTWDVINDIFYREVVRITETSWRFPEYRVVLSPFHPGIANRGNNVVMRWIYERPDEQLRTTAHEILMIHLWELFDTILPGSKESRDGGPFWGLNEITATAILGLEPSLNELWSTDKKGYDQFLQNYPQLFERKEKLKEVYLDTQNFRDYLTRAVEWGG